MTPKLTSLSVTRIAIAATAMQALGSNPRRRGLIFSGTSKQYSLSFAPGPVLGLATYNLFANQVHIETVCCCDVGTGLTGPVYGIAESGNPIIEITEILTDDATGSDF